MKEYAENLYFAHHISTLYRVFQVFLNSELQKYNIHASEVPCLVAMYSVGEKGMLQDDLVHLLALSKSVLSQSLKLLESKGYIYREKSTHSKRHKMIFPTQKALDMEQNIFDTFNKWMLIIEYDNESEKSIAMNKQLDMYAKKARKYKFL